MAKRMTITARRARRTKTVAGRRVARPTDSKPAAAKRKPAKSASDSGKRSRSPRREVIKIATTSVPLHYERVTGKITLTPPEGYMLSVLLKLVERSPTYKLYVWWLAVGRYGLDALSVPFNVNGADVIRCDVPFNFDFTTNQLEEGLVAFLKSDANEKLKLDGNGGGGVGGPGGTGKPG